MRDNIFIMNAIFNSINNGKEQAVDCQLYDVDKCFYSMWLHEAINDLYESSVNNDNLPLLFQENSKAMIAVKSSHGLSR